MLDLVDYWRQWPPVHELMRGFTGYKPPLERRNQEEREPNQVEAGLAKSLPARTFDNLPLDVQEWMTSKTKGKPN